MSVQHRPYWVGQIARHEALLDEPALPIQTLRIVRVRIAEARAMINAIDGNKDDADEQHFNG